MKLDNIMNIVFKITNLIRAEDNRSLNHRNFIKYIKELDCEHDEWRFIITHKYILA